MEKLGRLSRSLLLYQGAGVDNFRGRRGRRRLLWYSDPVDINWKKEEEDTSLEGGEFAVSKEDTERERER